MDAVKDLKPEQKVPFDAIFLDPNNPRIAPDDPPGYEDAAKITDLEVQGALAKRIVEEFEVGPLEDAIIGQGWVPMDAVVVWRLPGKKLAYVVIEGNRRTTALQRIRKRLEREIAVLESMKAKKRGYTVSDLAGQQRLVTRLKEIVRDTDELGVRVIEAKKPADLAKMLPRIMGVRHLAGVRRWSPYADGLYILGRYQQLFTARYPRQDLRLDRELVAAVAEEVSLGETVTRRAIQATTAFSSFRRAYTDRLPADSEFRDTDYYLFETLAKKPFLRDQFAFAEADLRVSKQGEEALFEWLFKEPRPAKAEESTNKFYRLENVIVWDQMKKYDDKNKTSFALRFDVTDPAAAPEMRVVEADWRLHEARQNPVDVIHRLIDELGRVPTEVLIDAAAALAEQMVELEKVVKKYKRIIAAAQE